MVYLLYNIALVVSAAFLVPYYLLRGLRYGKSRRGIRERLGFYAPEQLALFRGQRRVIWIHAVSVGETRAAIPLLQKVRSRYPEALILLTNVTETGHAIAREIPDVDIRLFFPFDFPWSVRRALEVISPDLILIVETEIWPNFTRQARSLNIPLILVNGRISDRSYPRYRLIRFVLRPILECFSAFCMQSQVDAERVISLGAAGDRVENTGNLKFDHDLYEVSEEQIAADRVRFRLPGKTAILVAGSTHEGEEKQLVEAYRRIQAEMQRPVVLVLIPRHPERKKEVQAQLNASGVFFRLRSDLQPDTPRLAPGEVLIVDTLGEVLDFYRLADLVFVGGSLVPVGGHNLLEAAFVSKPVLFGPHVHNFKEISKKLIRAGAGLKVNSQAELVRKSLLMLQDPARCRAMGEAGQTLIAENTGATERTMRHIQRLFPGTS